MSEVRAAFRPPRGAIRRIDRGCLFPGIVAGGFVVAPFDMRPDAIFSILPGKVFFGTCVGLPENPIYPFPEASTTREEHITRVAATVDFHSRMRGKTIMSRVEIVDTPHTADDIFDTLAEAYPDAFVFMFTSPATGTWVGASPELLLRSDGQQLHTMSLAGTRPASDTDAPWDGKNIEEQGIVTRFISDVFADSGLAPDVPDKPMTRRAGPVEHLCTPVSAPLPASWCMSDLAELLYRLSPTPALGGFPRRESLELISRMESHSRAYYGGFFGPVDSPSDFTLCVNLRSARLADGRACLFAGGGITRQSIPEEEWTETCRKAATLLAYLR